jgi:putative transposase
MTELDKQYLKTPFYGIRRMTAHLRSLSYSVNHKRVQRLMRKMGIEAVYRKPNTSLPNKEHTIYPYLLKGLKVMRPNQVWATDITYIPMAKGFMYLIAIVDLFSRKVLTWSVSNLVNLKFLILTRVRSLHPISLLKSSKTIKYRFRWTVRAEPLITFLWKEFGKASNMRTFT